MNCCSTTFEHSCWPLIVAMTIIIRTLHTVSFPEWQFPNAALYFEFHDSPAFLGHVLIIPAYCSTNGLLHVQVWFTERCGNSEAYVCSERRASVDHDDTVQWLAGAETTERPRTT